MLLTLALVSCSTYYYRDHKQLRSYSETELLEVSTESATLVSSQPNIKSANASNFFKIFHLSDSVANSTWEIKSVEIEKWHTPPSCDMSFMFLGLIPTASLEEIKGKFYLEHKASKAKKTISFHAEAGDGFGWFYRMKSWFQEDWTAEKIFADRNDYFQQYFINRLKKVD